jgi:hypothetical protein
VDPQDEGSALEMGVRCHGHCCIEPEAPSGCLHSATQTRQIIDTIGWFESLLAAVEWGEPPLRWASSAPSGSMQQCRLARVTDQLAVRIDPQTNKVTARYVPPAGSGGVAADDNGA